MNDALININGGSVQTLEIIFIMTIIMLLPSIVIMMTSFTRIVIVLSFLRNALGIQQTPPNSVLVGIAVFLTIFIMTPTLNTINVNAYTPYTNGEIDQTEFLERAAVPLKEFMLKNTEKSSLNLYLDFAGEELPEDVTEQELQALSLKIVIPSFITSELKRAFVMGFFLFVPFLLIDIVVSSTLMSMGMIMLPPSLISLPFKILLFVTLDGWHLLFSTLIRSFY